MPLKIKIMEVGEEEEIVVKDFEDYETAEWDGVWDEDREEEDDGIFLTDFTVDDYDLVAQDIEGKNEFLSRNIDGFQIKGRLGISDESKECANVDCIFEWYKETAHEPETYRKVVVEFRDVNNELYDTLLFEKAFIVDYYEKCTYEEGFLTFYAFIRKFDDTEIAITY